MCSDASGKKTLSYPPSHLSVQLPVEQKDTMWTCLSIWCQMYADCAAFAAGFWRLQLVICSYNKGSQPLEVGEGGRKRDR